eukprot:138534-Rhodomonas_salina.1
MCVCTDHVLTHLRVRARVNPGRRCGRSARGPRTTRCATSCSSRTPTWTARSTSLPFPVCINPSVLVVLQPSCASTIHPSFCINPSILLLHQHIHPPFTSTLSSVNPSSVFTSTHPLWLYFCSVAQLFASAHALALNVFGREKSMQETAFFVRTARRSLLLLPEIVVLCACFGRGADRDGCSALLQIDFAEFSALCNKHFLTTDIDGADLARVKS